MHLFGILTRYISAVLGFTCTQQYERLHYHWSLESVKFLAVLFWAFFQLPLDFDKLDQQQQLKLLSMRKPKQKVSEIRDTLDGDSFTANDYLKNFKAR